MDDGGVAITVQSKQKNDAKIRLFGGDTERKPLAVRIGAVCSSCVLPAPDPGYFRNQLIGVKERIFRAPPRISKTVKQQFIEFVSRWLDKHVGHQQVHVDFEDWINNARYTLVRKEQLRREYERGMLPESWKKVKSFVKREFYLSFKDPRIINSRVDNYKVFAGPWISAIEHWVCAHLPSFVKGMSPIERSSYLVKRLEGYSHYYNSDFSRFESHMTPYIIRDIECQLYRRFGMPEELLSPLWSRNECSMSCLNYSVNGTRMSGDMNTSLGNGFVNLMVNKFVASRTGIQIHGVVEGDDGLFGVVGRCPTAREFEEVGFRATVSEIYSISESNFCSTSIEILSNSVWSHTDPRRVLLRAGWSFVCPINANLEFRRELMAAKAMSIADANPGTPLLMAYCSKYFGKARWHRDSSYGCGEKYWSFSMFDKLQQPSDEIRRRFAIRYGLSIPDQLLVEKYILEHEDLDHPLLVNFLLDYAKDGLDFSQRFVY